MPVAACTECDRYFIVGSGDEGPGACPRCLQPLREAESGAAVHRLQRRPNGQSTDLAADHLNGAARTHLHQRTASETERRAHSLQIRGDDLFTAVTHQRQELREHLDQCRQQRKQLRKLVAELHGLLSDRQQTTPR